MLAIGLLTLGIALQDAAAFKAFLLIVFDMPK
jgi:hypothetical protein